MLPFAETLSAVGPLRRGARLALVATALATLATLAACATPDDRSGRAFYQPFRPSVQQGNWITQQQVAQLQPGLSREQVRFILGSPTLTPIFHANRWDYPYRYQPGYGAVQARNFTVWFEDDRLVRWEGDAQPTLQPFQQVQDDIREEAAAEAYNERYLIPDVTAGEPGDAIGTQGTVNPEPEVVAPDGLPRPGMPLDMSMSPDPALDPGAMPRGVYGPGTDTEPLR